MSTDARKKLSELLDLSGKTALVTGGAAGIGQAICSRLAEAGAHRTAGELRERGCSAEAHRMDVADAAQVSEVIERLTAARGGVDIVVNNAGVYPMRPFLQSDDALWLRTMEVNLLGAVRC